MASTKDNFSKDDIISSVENLITKKGVNSFSLKDVSKEAGISQGTLYYHFKSKDDLILALMEKHMGMLKSDFDAWLLRHKDGSITEEIFLDVIFYKGVKLFNKAKIHLYLVNECLSSSPSLTNEYVSLRSEWKSTIEQGIREFFPAIKDPASLSYILMLLIDGLTIQEALEETPSEEKNLIGIISQTIKEN